MVGILMAPMALVGCTASTPDPVAAPAPPTSASEARDAAVATTTIGSRAADAPATSGPVDGALLCGLLGPDDLAPLGAGFTPEAPEAPEVQPARCAWTGPAGRALTIGATALEAPPILAAQDYVRQRPSEAVGVLDLGDASLLLTTSAVRTTLVVFTGDVRLDVDAPSARDVAVGLAEAAVRHLGPRPPVAAAP
jgi:hypothetical protein